MSFTTNPVADSVLDRTNTFRLAHCWKITREDGTILRVTDHDAPLKNIPSAGNTYVPTGGFRSSARLQKSGTSVNNFDARGFIESSLITEEDLRAGRYDNAEIDEYIADWRYGPSMHEALRHDKWYLGRVTYTNEWWKAEIEGVSKHLDKRSGGIVSDLCRHQLGEGICGQGVDLETSAYKYTRTVGTVTDPRRIFTFVVAGPSDGLLDNGRCVWSTGDNAGVSAEVKNFTSGSNIVELEVPMPFDIQIGDTAILYAGCDFTESRCKTVFSNFDNFGGRPDVPGSDGAVPLRV